MALSQAACEEETGSLFCVLEPHKSSMREEKRGVTSCLSNGVLLTAGAKGCRQAWSSERTGSSQVLTSRRSPVLHAGDKERKSHHSSNPHR